MAHRHDVYRYGKYIEHEIKYNGRYGAKGEKRAPRKKATPEQIQKQNQYNKEKKVLRKIRCNFEAGDLWVTLKLPKGTRMRPEEVLKLRDRFFRMLKTRYKKQQAEMKYMYRIEIGERGGIHIHVLLNRLPGIIESISEIWKHLTGGHVNYTALYEEGGFKELAAYLVKKNKEKLTGQLTLFGNEEERKLLSRYGCSRNLKMPEKETHEYRRRTVRKLLEHGPTPTEGYYIDQDSIRCGVNPYTGKTYFYYTEIKLDWDVGKIKKECDVV